MTISDREAVSRNRGSEKSLYSNESSDQSSLTDKISDGVARLRNSGIDETTIPDTFANVPKLISPRVHAWLDVAVTGYFLALGVIFAARRKSGPATAAFINAGMVAGVSLFTDYEGTRREANQFQDAWYVGRSAGHHRRTGPGTAWLRRRTRVCIFLRTSGQ